MFYIDTDRDKCTVCRDGWTERLALHDYTEKENLTTQIW